MNQLELYYRAFLEYRKLTEADGECAKQRNIISHSNPDTDRLEAIRFYCHINEDWINEIEAGLVFVEKAIKEERQFIRNDGEVVPIEKAKHIDKHSVEHLARHSEFISRMPEDGTDDIVPDKLYMVERDSDYAVYENRFLYMMLRYLADFIDMRLARITELGNTYRASTQMKKSIGLGKRHMDFEVKLAEERRNDPLATLNEEAQILVNKIEGLEHWVRALLATPLMEQVAKVPMIKPPITKTNVLRMNNNFKKAVALYEYVASYEGDGYSIEEVKKVYNPFTDSMADEFSEIVLLSSFLTYEYGNDIKSELRASYDAEEERRRQEEKQKVAAQIAAMKKRIKETGESPDEYMLALEKRNKSLEEDSAALKVKIEENARLGEEIRRLEGERDRAENTVAELLVSVGEKEAEIEAWGKKYAADMAAKAAEYEAEIAEMKKEFAVQMAEAKSEFEQQLNSERQAFSEKWTANEQETRRIRAEMETDYRQKAAEIEAAASAKVEEYKQRADSLQEENTLVRAQLTGLRAQHGHTADMDDFSSKERFEELEAQLQAFVTLFDDEWKKARKKIRKDILWTIENSGKGKKNKD